MHPLQIQVGTNLLLLLGRLRRQWNRSSCQFTWRAPDGPWVSDSYFISLPTLLMTFAILCSSQGKPPWYAVYVPSDTYGKIVKMTMIPSPSNQKVACIQLQQTDGTIAAYVANITKTTDPATGLMTYTYIENGIVSQATNSYQSTCAGYKPTLWCTAKTYNYQCTMVFAVRT